jgi:hypothetical protein
MVKNLADRRELEGVLREWRGALVTEENPPPEPFLTPMQGRENRFALQTGVRPQLRAANSAEFRPPAEWAGSWRPRSNEMPPNEVGCTSMFPYPTSTPAQYPYRRCRRMGTLIGRSESPPHETDQTRSPPPLRPRTNPATWSPRRCRDLGGAPFPTSNPGTTIYH